MDRVNGIAGADVHHLVEAPWAGVSREESMFGQPLACEDMGGPYAYADASGAAVGLAQLAEGDPALPKWRMGAACLAHGAQPPAGAGESLASAPREMTCDFRDDPLGAPVPVEAPQAAFQVGEKVAYWSDTHRLWMQACVTKPNIQDGAVVSYDLDVKRGAQVGKIQHLPQQPEPWEPITPPGGRGAGRTTASAPREAPAPSPPASTAIGGPAGGAPEKAGAPGAAPAPQGAALAEDAEARFDVGDRVEYWSETYQQWMAAVVNRVKEAGALYDLDVKRGAQAKRMRHAQSGDGPGAGQPAPAGGQGAAPGPAAAGEGAAPTRAGSLLRGPSPLSGRGRGGGSASPARGAGAGEPEAPEDRVPPRAPEAPARPASGMGGLTPPCAAKPKAGLSLPVHNGGEARPAHLGACLPAGAAASPQTQPHAGRALACAAPAAGPGEAPGPSAGAATPGGGAASPSAAALAARTAGAPGERAPPRPSATTEGVTRAGPLFMGTGMEGRRREPGASPAHGGRAGAATAAPRASLAGAAAACRRDAAPVPVAASAGASSPACSSSSGGRALEVGELDIGSGPFDPTHQSLRSQLIAKLNLGGHATIEEMQGFRGGLNEGVWYLSDPSQGSGKNGSKEELVLKLVKCQRVAHSIPTEAENCLKIYREHPEVINDPTVAFPFKILSCIGANGVKRYDLIIMRKVRGERLAELIARKWYTNQVPQLMQILEKLGVCLAEFHVRYGSSQHGDFQPSNIFCDEEREEIALIDVGGMGVPTMESDVEHFAKSMKLLAEAYGSQLSTDGMRHFERGYAKVAGKG